MLVLEQTPGRTVVSETVRRSCFACPDVFGAHRRSLPNRPVEDRRCPQGCRREKAYRLHGVHLLSELRTHSTKQRLGLLLEAFVIFRCPPVFQIAIAVVETTFTPSKPWTSSARRLRRGVIVCAASLACRRDRRGSLCITPAILTPHFRRCSRLLRGRRANQKLLLSTGY